MTPLLRQFLLESREALQNVGRLLLELEEHPSDAGRMNDLFRNVHTFKGNCGLFPFPELGKVLHAAEDLMDAVRAGRVAFDRALADELLEAMDFVGLLLDEIEATGEIASGHSADADRLAGTLRLRVPSQGAAVEAPAALALSGEQSDVLAVLPAEARAIAEGRLQAGVAVFLVLYRPEEQCFFKGEDPLHLARTTPGLLWYMVDARLPWPDPSELDCYRCVLDFRLLVEAFESEIRDHFRYVPEQFRLLSCAPTRGGNLAAGGATESGSKSDPVATAAPGMASLQPGLREALEAILSVQATILELPDAVTWISGRLEAVGATLGACLQATGIDVAGLSEAVAESVKGKSAGPLSAWLSALRERCGAGTPDASSPGALSSAAREATDSLGEVAFSRRAEDNPSSRILKVDQAKVDRLMDLIGEMVVAKNALPYLAARAEGQYGVRDLAREIKAQHAVINRIAEEMQDAILQVRMMPVSFVFQRFPRLVRDLSRRLGKEIDLRLEGEDTEADKNVVESLADPLIHVVRNSLDHGIEPPEARRAAGKPAVGRLAIRARQESDRVVIEVEDDGRGIDPAVIRRKAVAKGLLDEDSASRLSDQQAVELVFAPGFSTVETVSDLSGRGVGMDVVRSAVERVGGGVELRSQPGEGTTLRLSLPLSMAVTNVMIVESGGQIFGIPMDIVVETVRIPRPSIQGILDRRATVLRGRVVPLVALNDLLATGAAPLANGDDELAALVVRAGGGRVGLLVDNFREVVDIILKPLPGELGKLAGYAGSALLGDGSVLMVLDPKELL